MLGALALFLSPLNDINISLLILSDHIPRQYSTQLGQSLFRGLYFILLEFHSSSLHNQHWSGKK